MSRRQPKDPQAKRESANYDNPIASRELILERLRAAGLPRDIGAIAEDLDLASDQDLEALRRRLRAMCRDSQLLMDRRGRYALVEKLDLVAGRVQAHRDGFGWLRPEDGSADVYLHERQLHSAMDGDRVLVRISGERRDGKREGVVAEVVDRAHARMTGRIDEMGGVCILVPANPRLNQEILINPGDRGGARSGDWVEVELTRYPERHQPAWGRVVEVLSTSDDFHRTRVDVVLGAQGIPRKWPDAVDRAVERLPTVVATEDTRKRVDLRELDLVTIDGEDARDFDDAVFCEKKRGGGWRLLVAIADVSHYVHPGSGLDEEAENRGNSVYLPSTVVPMLPEALSNELCSLKPQVDRLCLVCEMAISAKGRLGKFQFFEGVMRSSARLTYTRVGALFDKGLDGVRDSDPEIVPLAERLLELRQLYLALREGRAARGTVDFESTESRIVIGDDGRVAEIVPVHRNDAHRLIEECMISANVAAARFFEKHKLPALYRVHAEPDPARIEELRGFLAGLGVQLGGSDIPEPRDLKALIESVAHRPDRHVIEVSVLRSMNQAVYQPVNEGHFGLALPAYTHFTSPIRRYADLLVHRGIRHVIRSRLESEYVQRVRGAGAMPKEKIYPYEQPRLVNVGEHISMTERRADAASRDMIDWLKCEFMEQHLGAEFEGTVTGVTNFGLFVELDDLYVQGLAHVTMLPGDYYHFDSTHRLLQGESTKTVFGLGDRLRVAVARVDVEERKIDFTVLEQLTKRKPPRRSGKQEQPRSKQPRRGRSPRGRRRG
ncbi:MAG: ribonuclease R [Gammaproteobacteria bacterium]|nr:MAG: ribonuclease R [Gammaproteobacteria bacterium]